jgi:hypothetical protein
MSAVRPPQERAWCTRARILLVMGGESGRVGSLPLLPAGSSLFEALPARAIVLDALAPAIGNGVITMTDADRTGVLVIRDGGISDAVSIGDGARSSGDAALELIRGWESASLSACRWTDSAMSLLEPLIRGEPCYEGLRLEWTAWPQLLEDLRARGGTFVVELFTPIGRGVTVIRGGQQVATYSDAHPSLGDPDLIDILAAGDAGSVRVLVAPRAAPRGDNLVRSTLPVPPQPDPSAASGPDIAAADLHDGNAAFSALFGTSPWAVKDAPLVVLDRAQSSARSEVRALLPELKLLVHNRLQRSSGPVDEVVDAAADDDRSVEWLAQRVRVMTVRGFMASTFEQLADNMLALADRA